MDLVEFLSVELKQVGLEEQLLGEMFDAIDVILRGGKLLITAGELLKRGSEVVVGVRVLHDGFDQRGERVER